MCTLHAGGKFSDQNYQFSGGLHGVGVSVVNALSRRLDVTIKRNGHIHRMSFADGNKASELEIIGKTTKRDTGTTVHFLPDGKYFDTVKFAVKQLKHNLRAKAVLCPGLRLRFVDASSSTPEITEWYYENGLRDYLSEAVREFITLPELHLQVH